MLERAACQIVAQHVLEGLVVDVERECALLGLGVGFGVRVRVRVRVRGRVRVRVMASLLEHYEPLLDLAHHTHLGKKRSRQRTP